MQRITDIHKEIVELMKQKMELEFTPVTSRQNSYITTLRNIKKKITQLEIEKTNWLRSRS